MHHFSRMRALRLSLPLALILLIAIGLQFTGLVDAQQTRPALSCPAGTTQIDLVTWDAVLTAQYNQTLDVSLTLNSAATAGTLLVQSQVGHPEAGCPASGSPLCSDQDNESFNVLADGAQVAFVPDHGNDRWQTFSVPLPLSTGDHTVTFAHSLAAGNNPFGSVFVNAVYCIGVPPVPTLPDCAGVDDACETEEPLPPPLPDTTVGACADSDGSAGEGVRLNVVPSGLTGLYCRIFVENGRVARPNALAEIGDPAVIALGIQQAVDVFHLGAGNVSGTQLCLRGSGGFLFLSAASSPRVVQALPTTADADFTCAALPSAGIAVLVQIPFDLSRSLDGNAAATTLLTDCRVTTQNMLNLRGEPNTDSAVITVVPYDLTLTATEAVPGWYRVIFEDGQGWLSAAYLTMAGSCGG